MLDWSKVPHNRNKLYVTVTLPGGCDLFVPIRQAEHAEQVKKVLYEFIKRQALDTMPEPPEVA